MKRKLETPMWVWETTDRKCQREIQSLKVDCRHETQHISNKEGTERFGFCYFLRKGREGTYKVGRVGLGVVQLHKIENEVPERRRLLLEA